MWVVLARVNSPHCPPLTTESLLMAGNWWLPVVSVISRITFPSLPLITFLHHHHHHQHHHHHHHHHVTLHSLVCVLGGGYVVLLEGSVQKPWDDARLAHTWGLVPVNTDRYQSGQLSVLKLKDLPLKIFCMSFPRDVRSRAKWNWTLTSSSKYGDSVVGVVRVHPPLKLRPG